MGYKANVKQHRQRRHLVVPNHLFEKPEVSGVEHGIIVTEEENVPAEEMGDMKTMEKVEFENKVECEVCGKKYKNRKTLSGHQYKVHRELMTGKEVKCEVCDRKYKNRISLNYHQHRNHQQELEERMGAVENLEEDVLNETDFA